VNGLIAFSIVLSVLAAVLAMWGRRWMRVGISIVLFLFAVDVIVFGFGSAARSVAGAEIAKGNVSKPYLRGIMDLRAAMGPYEIALLAMCCGFLALGVGRKTKTIRPIEGSANAKRWEVDAPRDFAGFLRALPVLFDSPRWVLYLEGTDTPPLIETYLRQHGTGSGRRMPGGTLLPKPEVFHLPITTETVAELASLLESIPSNSPPTHVHVYGDEGVALEWYDASAGDPMHLSEPLDPERIAEFCERIGCSYRQEV